MAPMFAAVFGASGPLGPDWLDSSLCLGQPQAALAPMLVANGPPSCGRLPLFNSPPSTFTGDASNELRSSDLGATYASPDP
jgi:hypothetical protein